MIINLDLSVGEEIDHLTSDEWNALELLAQAACQGKHLMLIDTSLAKTLIDKAEHFSQRSVAFFRRQYERASTRPRGLLVQAPIVFHACRDKSISKVVNGSQVSFRCPLAHFDSLKNVDSVTLACEDTNDYDCLMALASHFLAKLRLQAFGISLTLGNGGGSGIERVVDSLSKEGKCFLVITDSDKDAPGKPLGGTAHKISKYIGKSSHKLCEHIVPECRELENLIPDSVFCETLDQMPRSSDFIHRLSEVGLSTLRLYGDFKHGITMQLFRDHLEITPDIDRDALNRLIESAAIISDQSCIGKDKCHKADCECFAMPPNGGKECKIVPRSVAVINRMQGQQLWSNLCEAHLGEIDRVLSRIAYWGLADRPIRA